MSRTVTLVDDEFRSFTIGTDWAYFAAPGFVGDDATVVDTTPGFL